jgi:hypothetical protein
LPLGVAAPTYDESEWPLFRARMPSTALSEAEFSGWLERLDQLFRRGERFALLLDVRDAPLPTATERQDVAKLLRTWHSRHPYRMAAQAVVLKSALQRGILTAILWLAGPSYPTRPFSRRVDAETWLRDMLRARTGSSTHPGV